MNPSRGSAAPWNARATYLSIDRRSRRRAELLTELLVESLFHRTSTLAHFVKDFLHSFQR